MPTTLATLIDHAEVALGGEFDGRVSPTDVVNQAGEHLVSMHEWVSFQRAVTPLNLVADHNFIELPDDFARLVDIESTNSITKDVFITSIEEVERLRQDLVTNLFDHFVALSWPAQADTNRPAPTPRLEVWPTPSTSETNAMRLIYEAGWRYLHNMNDMANIPAFMDSLLIELVRTFTLGYLRSGGGQAMVFHRLEQLENSRMFESAKERDGTQQYDYGMMKGGAVGDALYRSVPYRPYRSIGR